jgi:hypothetical protein
VRRGGVLASGAQYTDYRAMALLVRDVAFKTTSGINLDPKSDQKQ